MDKKITQLTQVTELTGAELLPLAQGGVTKSASVDQLRGYQVYTALLTQSGGDGPLGNCSDDPQPLVIGVTYLITLNDGTGDFTNVGAPNNNVGTYFVATGTTPNNWGTSGDVCLEYNTGAPVVTVLDNTIGNVWFTYFDVGIYRVNSNNLFIQDKTFVSVSPTVQNGGDGISQTVQFVGGSESDTDILTIQTAGAGQDGIPNRTPIEIRVYN